MTKGRTKSTGNFSTREELEEFAYIQSVAYHRPDSEIAKNAGVSSTTICNIVKEFEPSPLQQIEALEIKVSIARSRNENPDYLEKKILALREQLSC